ncbi:MAG: thioredoxin family protein [Blastocatellia bacterium]
MAFISDYDQGVIREHLEKHMESEVEMVLFTQRPSVLYVPGRQECETCKETQQLLEELIELSGKIKLTVHEIGEAREEAFKYGVDRVPAIILKGAGRGLVRFFGIPSGYEFTSFLDDIVDASKGTTELSQETKDFLAGLDRNVNIKVFTTPT